MDEGDSGVGGMFRREFLARGLVTFAECSDYYASLGVDALMAEMRRLFSPPVLAIPFAVSGTRYYALMSALIRCAGLNCDLTDSERTKLVNICIDVCTFLRSRTDERRQDAFTAVMSAALDTVALEGAFPEVATLIAQGNRNYAGPYVPSPAMLLQAHQGRREAGRSPGSRNVA